jgi:hypothetical protein
MKRKKNINNHREVNAFVEALNKSRGQTKGTRWNTTEKTRSILLLKNMMAVVGVAAVACAAGRYDISTRLNALTTSGLATNFPRSSEANALEICYRNECKSYSQPTLKNTQKRFLVLSRSNPPPVAS